MTSEVEHLLASFRMVLLVQALVVVRDQLELVPVEEVAATRTETEGGVVLVADL